MKNPLQFIGPYGAEYFDPDDVIYMGPEYKDPYYSPEEAKTIRDVMLRGAFQYIQILDTAENVGKILHHGFAINVQIGGKTVAVK